MNYLLCSAYNLKSKLRLCFYSNYCPLLVVIRRKTDSAYTMKYLNVAEKNDAAKNIALHLSRGTSRRVNKLVQLLFNLIF